MQNFMHRHLIIFYILLAMLSVTTTRAQVGERRSDFAVGVNAGYNMSRMDFNPSIKQTYKTGPEFGISARYISEKYFTAICGVLVELNYVPMGWKEVIDDGSGNQFSATLNYVQMPLLLQMGWGRERRGLKFVFEAGPQIGYLLGISRNFGGGTWNTANRPNGVVWQYEHDPDHSFEYGITAGLGVELSTKTGHFILDGRYYFGLGDIYDNSKKGYFTRSANSAIQVRLSYLFDLHLTKNNQIR